MNKKIILLVVIVSISIAFLLTIYKTTTHLCPDGSYPTNYISVYFKDDLSMNKMESVFTKAGFPQSSFKDYKEYYGPSITYTKLPNQAAQLLLEQRLESEKSIKKCGEDISYDISKTSCSFTYDVTRADIERTISKYPEIKGGYTIIKQDRMELDAPNFEIAKQWFDTIEKLPEVRNASFACIGPP